MATKTRYVVTYKSYDPQKTGTVSYGVWAKKKSVALKTTREYIYTNELHENPDLFDYKLDAEPSNKPALHEIPDEDNFVEEAVEEYDEFHF